MKIMWSGIIVLLVIGGVAAWFVSTHKNSAPSDGVACTAEAMLCPDGSYVGRTGPNCEFAACPTVASSTPTPTPPKGGEGAFCGGIAAGAFPCATGYVCVLNGTYPDASGHCTKQ